MSIKKSRSKEALKPEKPETQETPVEALPEPEKESTTIPNPDEQAFTPEPTPELPPTPPLTMKYLYQEIQTIKAQLVEQSQLITQLQETLARKRKPVTSNGKIQIRDKQTGTVYPSKNNYYQSLLKSGELKDLVDKGLFGDIPQKNTFGWYVLVCEWSDRFEEVHKAAQ